jgi:hypothetical protein
VSEELWRRSEYLPLSRKPESESLLGRETAISTKSPNLDLVFFFYKKFTLGAALLDLLNSLEMSASPILSS